EAGLSKGVLPIFPRLSRLELLFGFGCERVRIGKGRRQTQSPAYQEKDGPKLYEGRQQRVRRSDARVRCFSRCLSGPLMHRQRSCRLRRTLLRENYPAAPMGQCKERSLL